MDFHSRRKKSIPVAITMPPFNYSRVDQLLSPSLRCHEEDERMLGAEETSVHTERECEREGRLERAV